MPKVKTKTLIIRLLIVLFVPFILSVIVYVYSIHIEPIKTTTGNTVYLVPSDFDIFVTNIFNLKPEELTYNFCLVNNNVTNVKMVIGILTIDNKHLEEKYPEFGAIEMNFSFPNNQQRKLYGKIGETKCLITKGGDLLNATGTISALHFTLSSSTLTPETAALKIQPTINTSIDTSKSMLRSSLTSLGLCLVFIGFLIVWSGLILLVRETVKFVIES